MDRHGLKEFKEKSSDYSSKIETYITLNILLHSESRANFFFFYNTLEDVLLEQFIIYSLLYANNFPIFSCYRS